MWESIVNGVIKLYQASPRFMLAICIACGGTVFVTDRFFPVPAQFRFWIFFVFIFSCAIGVTYAIQHGWSSLRKRQRSQERRRSGITRLHFLDRKEKDVINLFIARNERSLHFDSNDATVANLIVAGVLYHPVRVAPINRFPTAIQEWAWTYLHEHPECLEGAAVPRPPGRYDWMAR